MTDAGRCLMRRSRLAVVEAGLFVTVSAGGFVSGCIAAGAADRAGALLGLGLMLGALPPSAGAIRRHGGYERDFARLAVRYVERVERATKAAALRRLRVRAREARAAGQHGRLVADLVALAGRRAAA
jgi:hypothetical protein